MSCKFILSDISEGEITDDEGYSIFEPTLALEINGKNVFHAIGIDGAKIVVIMHFREDAIGKTLKMIHDLSKEDTGEYNYWLLGTGFVFRLERKALILKIFLEVNNMGPTQGVSSPKSVHVGTISVDDWIEAFVSLSTLLSEMFRRLNPRILDDPMFKKQEAKISQITESLKSRVGQP